ncbi:MAG: ATP-binding cassette domain-containing protein, partial [Kiloniellaceae bacterium]|nr:ATP-binding cassette domain-containing protein [Kiloniellaceae bacterium]
MERGSTAAPVLRVDDLRVDFATEHGWANVVNGVCFDVGDDEIVGLVGESGSGKTVTGLSMLGLVPTPPGRTSGGSVWFRDENTTQMPMARLRQIRGNEVSMIFQEPMTSLNPAFTIGDQIAETYRRHRRAGRRAAMARAVEMLDMVGIPNPSRRVRDYPHEFSGGMRQR